MLSNPTCELDRAEGLNKAVVDSSNPKQLEFNIEVARQVRGATEYYFSLSICHAKNDSAEAGLESLSCCSIITTNLIKIPA